MDIVDRIFLLVDKMYSEQREFAADLGVPASRVSEWRRKKSESYMKRLPQIAEILNTTVEYLLTGEKKEPAPILKNGDELNRDAIMAAFWGGEKDLSPEDLEDMWNDVERFAAFLAEKKRQEKKDD